MKAQFIYERLEFDRGNNPLDSLNIGNKGARIYQKLSDITQVLNIEEVGIEDLNKKKAIASWRIPGIKGNIDWTGYGRIILYLNDIGGEKEYQVYAKGKRGSDIQSWENWNSIDKWKENLHQLNESVNFERGKDPKEIMDIGVEKILKSKKYPDNDFYNSRARIKIRDLMGIPLDEIYYLGEDHPALVKHQDKILALLKQDLPGSKSVHLDFYDLKFWPTPKGRLLSVQGTWGTRYYGDKQMAYYYFGQRESLEFERGKEPYDSLGIGANRKISKGDIFNAIFRFNDDTGYNIAKGPVKVISLQDEERNPEYSERTTIGRVIGYEEKGTWVCVWDDNLKKWVIE